MSKRDKKRELWLAEALNLLCFLCKSLANLYRSASEQLVLRRLSRRLSQTLESITCDSRTPECLSRWPLETCESDVQINTRPVSHVPTAPVDRKYRFPYMASCRLPYMGILRWGAGYFRCASYFRVVRVQPVALGSLQYVWWQTIGSIAPIDWNFFWIFYLPL